MLAERCVRSKNLRKRTILFSRRRTMKYQRKGGIWKNSEDEILKAAVSKYGRNQWARISSLLVRKSAKQCKLRWAEYLDPALNKSSWRRGEEEQLLHLAKIMPCQWRTIGPLIGRTPQQCLEHYGRLLEEVQGGSGGSEPALGLGKGEIDPHAESRPSIPDAVDMDEDELEMLSEARARLANTKGKKAKRKARERQLHEARRLATLQKRRELKAAGLEYVVGSGRKRKKTSEEMDYIREIPFQKLAPAGLFDTSKEDEAARAQKVGREFKGIDLKEMEGEKRWEREERQKKQDEKRQKLLKETNLPEYVKRLNASQQIAGRSRLVLPAPRVSSEELKKAMPLDDGFQVSLNLQTPTPMRTPLRTPLRNVSENRTEKVKELISLTSAQTPLLGETGAHAVEWRDSIQEEVEQEEEDIDQLLFRQKSALSSLFASLPAPKNEYEITVSKTTENRSKSLQDPQQISETDQEIIDKKLKERHAFLEESKRSSVSRLGLAVPDLLPLEFPVLGTTDARIINLLSAKALELIQQDMSHQNMDTPLENRQEIEEMIKTECGEEEFDLPKRPETKFDKEEFEELYRVYKNMVKQNKKMSKQLGVVLGGYQKVYQELKGKIDENNEEISHATQQKACYERLLERELIGGKERLLFWENTLKDCQEKERTLQKLFSESQL